MLPLNQEDSCNATKISIIQKLLIQNFEDQDALKIENNHEAHKKFRRISAAILANLTIDVIKKIKQWSP